MIELVDEAFMTSCLSVLVKTDLREQRFGVGQRGLVDQAISERIGF